MQLELHINLPKDSRALLEVPLDILDEMKKNLAGLKVIKIDKKPKVWISVIPYIRSTISERSIFRREPN